MEYFIEDCIENRWISIPLFTALVWGLSHLIIFVLLRGRHLSVRSVKIRNEHQALTLAVPFMILYYLFSREMPIGNPSIFAISLTAIFAYYFENAKHTLFYETVFGLLVFVMVFTKWYYFV